MSVAVSCSSPTCNTFGRDEPGRIGEHVDTHGPAVCHRRIVRRIDTGKDTIADRGPVDPVERQVDPEARGVVRGLGHVCRDHEHLRRHAAAVETGPAESIRLDDRTAQIVELGPEDRVTAPTPHDDHVVFTHSVPSPRFGCSTLSWTPCQSEFREPYGKPRSRHQRPAHGLCSPGYAPHLRGSRRGTMATSGLITILFTDLVGSTAHASTVGDPAADEMRRDHFASLREAVVATGGTEVKTIGDALMVSYPGAADALSGAATMQRAVERHNRRLADGNTIAMRVGISAGDASFEDGDWFGTPVVEAARLCAAASGGQILASDLVRALAGSRTDLELRSLGALELKGLPEPLPACEVVWQISDQITATPLPAFVDTNPAFPFSGRMDQLETLTTAWKETAEGTRRAGARLGRARHRQDPPRHRGGTRRARPWIDRAVGPLRRGPRRAVRSLRRGAAPLRLRHPARSGARRDRRARRRARADRARHHQPRPRSRRADGGRRGDRALPAVRRGGRPALRDLGRGTRGAGARRPALGRQAVARPAPPPPPLGDTDARARSSAPTATPTSTAATRCPTCSATCAASPASTGSTCTASTRTRSRASWRTVAGHELDEGGLRPRASRCTPRPRGTRSSSARCCATSPSPARSSRTTTGAGPPRARSRTSVSPKACARWSAVGSPACPTR